MKVTVCFGNIRVVVPCGNGQVLVKNLISEAARRYKKAIGRDPNTLVVIHHLQTQSGILDPDDFIGEVADDKEQILASFEENEANPRYQQGGGDGASRRSSIGTESPDFFQDREMLYEKNMETPDIEVTGNMLTEANTGLGLQVRRSSDPSIADTLHNTNIVNKRWSAAAPAFDSLTEKSTNKLSFLLPQWEEEDQISDYFVNSQNSLTDIPFTRSSRLSIQFGGENSGYKWMDAAEKVQNERNVGVGFKKNIINNYSPKYTQGKNTFLSKSLPREISKRKEPLGQAYESIKESEIIIIPNEEKSKLGLTAIPDHHLGGLLVQHVDSGSKAEAGRLKVGDRIVEINGKKLIGVPEIKVQKLLCENLFSKELKLKVIRGKELKATYDKKKSPKSEKIEDKKINDITCLDSPIKKIPGSQVGVSLQVANTRKIGKKIEINLKKGNHGLGFSLTARDNPAGGQCPIYIKTILPRGAAIEDGRLKPGDRLLEVDGRSIDGKSQAEAVSLFRAIKQGATVKIVVSRQQELVNQDSMCYDEANKVSETIRNLNDSETVGETHFIDGGNEYTETSIASPYQREILTFNIPVHDTEKAGLGVSVKGKTASNNNSNYSKSIKNDGDLGIFVKSVIHGGAASRDGRLKMNDQLLSINGVSLLGQNNAEAMENLRKAMLQIKQPGVISLTVARKQIKSLNSSKENIGEMTQSFNSSNNSDLSGATVIYLNSPDTKNLKENFNISSENQNQYSKGIRNQSYCLATNDSWARINTKDNVSINESENLANINGIYLSESLSNKSKNQNEALYSSEQSLSTNNSAEAFSRDAVGRRSISEKHHSALDAKETGTYQRNKKLREEREMRKQYTKSVCLSNSIESLVKINDFNENNHPKYKTELTKANNFGPYLGLQKSSSLESLQTMVHEIEAAKIDLKPSKIKIADPKLNNLEDVFVDQSNSRGNFSMRNGLFQSSLNEGKCKNRIKKSNNILRGIGHMFRFGKPRRETNVRSQISENSDYHFVENPYQTSNYHYKPIIQHNDNFQYSQNIIQKSPKYQPINDNIHQINRNNNSRYQHYVNFKEIQNDISEEPNDDLLSDTTLENLRKENFVHKSDVKAGSRNHQYYHSQRKSFEQENDYRNNNQAFIQRSKPQPYAASIIQSEDEHHLQGRVHVLNSSGRNMKTQPSQKIGSVSNWRPVLYNTQGSVISKPTGKNQGPYVTHVSITEENKELVSRLQTISNIHKNLSSNETNFKSKTLMQPQAKV